jgi:hypothetical protein
MSSHHLIISGFKPAQKFVGSIEVSPQVFHCHLQDVIGDPDSAMVFHIVNPIVKVTVILPDLCDISLKFCFLRHLFYLNRFFIGVYFVINNGDMDIIIGFQMFLDHLPDLILEFL